MRALLILMPAVIALWPYHDLPPPTPLNDDSRFFRVFEDSTGVSWLRRDPPSDQPAESPVNNSHFISTGITCMHLKNAACNGTSLYDDALKKKYGTEYVDKWKNSTLERMNTWGFNTAGAWSYNWAETFGRATRPWVQECGLSSALKTLSSSPPLEESHAVYDFFDPKFLPALANKAKNCAQAGNVNDTNLVGYFLSNEVWWGGYVDEWPVVFRETDTILLQYLNLSASTGGHQDAVQFLKEKYGSISELNKAWNVVASSFDTIADELPFLLPSEHRQADEHEYIKRVSSYFFAHAHNAIRKHDTNHLILGTRFAFFEMPMEAVAEEVPYTDVTSYNGYLWIPGLSVAKTVAKIHQHNGGKPIMISEYGFRAEENQSEDLNLDGGAGLIYLTQQKKADVYKEYIPDLMSLPYVVGFHHWKLVDDSPHSCNTKRNSNWGLLDVYDNDYPLYQEAVTETNARVMELHSTSGKAQL